ncbi:hypothetical protein EEB11_15720 [Pseudotabrizicola sediminis]|uniref:Uncharacterized protein n=2 Tax=Pseudotabrizicola sediminis TaxID=2486418 RepID=A0ABY2KLC6_9RHOB|nr:hypothetical protein EEB11_15720 [Pseudotabrizicola sediminis]
MLHSILTKLFDLDDALQKTRRHFMIYDPSAKVIMQREAGEVSFSTPLQGLWRLIEFSVSERTFLLRLRGGDFFTALSDVNGISENFHVLRERHKQAYYTLLEEVVAGGVTRRGYLVTSVVDTTSHNLMVMMDVDGALRSLLESSSGTVVDFLNKMIDLSNEMTERKIAYEVTYNPPASENYMRQEY